MLPHHPLDLADLLQDRVVVLQRDLNKSFEDPAKQTFLKNVFDPVSDQGNLLNIL